MREKKTQTEIDTFGKKFETVSVRFSDLFRREKSSVTTLRAPKLGGDSF